MNEWFGMLCLGSIVLLPMATFVAGFLIGRNKLPFTIRIERNNVEKYVVED